MKVRTTFSKQSNITLLKNIFNFLKGLVGFGSLRGVEIEGCPSASPACGFHKVEISRQNDFLLCPLKHTKSGTSFFMDGFIKTVGGQTFWFWVGSLSYQKKEGMKFISGSFDLRLRQGLESLHAKILDSYTSNFKNPETTTK